MIASSGFGRKWKQIWKVGQSGFFLSHKCKRFRALVLQTVSFRRDTDAIKWIWQALLHRSKSVTTRTPSCWIFQEFQHHFQGNWFISRWSFCLFVLVWIMLQKRFTENPTARPEVTLITSVSSAFRLSGPQCGERGKTDQGKSATPPDRKSGMTFRWNFRMQWIIRLPEFYNMTSSNYRVHISKCTAFHY